MPNAFGQPAFGGFGGPQGGAFQATPQAGSPFGVPQQPGAFSVQHVPGGFGQQAAFGGQQNAFGGASDPFASDSSFGSSFAQVMLIKIVCCMVAVR